MAFSSAIDCWSFTIPTLSQAIAKKLGMRPKPLEQFLWGEFYYDPAEKKVLK